ncbi:tetratricopeptide repeat protein [Clostridium sp.]|uniref:tetratricopeptide repeat protein n=1 Tax=Clostridium sp. TaxID=1506 RepID=UPI003D6CA735
MLTNINEENFFVSNVNKAIREIKSNRCDLAINYLNADIIENSPSAEVFNLLGIIAEYRGDESMACKYYRAAYVFDPTYKPADKNLEKLTSFFYRFNEECLDFGDMIEKEDKKTYFLEYKGIHLGHIKNNKVDRKSAC